MKRLTFLLLGACMCIGSSASCDSQTTGNAAANMAHNPVMSNPELTTFHSLVETANLVNFFEGTGPFTAFVPSNAAFDKLNKKTLDELKDPKNRDHLIDLINYHVVLGKRMSQHLKSGRMRTVNGKEITIRVEDGQIWVNNAKVTKTDLVGPNGVAYIIDTVLIP